MALYSETGVELKGESEDRVNYIASYSESGVALRGVELRGNSEDHVNYIALYSETGVELGTLRVLTT